MCWMAARRLCWLQNLGPGRGSRGVRRWRFVAELISRRESVPKIEFARTCAREERNRSMRLPRAGSALGEISHSFSEANRTADSECTQGYGGCGLSEGTRMSRG